MVSQTLAEMLAPILFVFCLTGVVIYFLQMRYRRQKLEHAEAMRSLELRLPLPPRPAQRVGNIYSLPLAMIGLGIGIGLLVLMNGEAQGIGVMAMLSLPGIGLLLAIRLNRRRQEEQEERTRRESDEYRAALRQLAAEQREEGFPHSLAD